MLRDIIIIIIYTLCDMPYGHIVFFVTISVSATPNFRLQISTLAQPFKNSRSSLTVNMLVVLGSVKVLYCCWYESVCSLMNLKCMVLLRWPSDESTQLAMWGSMHGGKSYSCPDALLCAIRVTFSIQTVNIWVRKPENVALSTAVFQGGGWGYFL